MTHRKPRPGNTNVIVGKAAQIPVARQVGERTVPGDSFPGGRIPVSGQGPGPADVTAHRAIHLSRLRSVHDARPCGAGAVQAGRVASASGWGGLGLLRPGTRDELPVAHRIVADGQLQHTQEDQPAAARAAAVEPEAELVQVAGQVVDVHCALVGGQQPSRGRRRHAVDPGQWLADVLAQRLGGALAAPVVRMADLVDAQVAGPSVGDHRGPWREVAGDERVQRRGGAIRDDAHPTPPETLGRLDLHGNNDQRLLALGPAAGQPGLLTADVGLVDLHMPGQQLPAGSDQHLSQPVQHRPRPVW